MTHCSVESVDFLSRKYRSHFKGAYLYPTPTFKCILGDINYSTINSVLIAALHNGDKLRFANRFGRSSSCRDKFKIRTGNFKCKYAHARSQFQNKKPAKVGSAARVSDLNSR